MIFNHIENKVTILKGEKIAAKSLEKWGYPDLSKESKYFHRTPTKDVWKVQKTIIIYAADKKIIPLAEETYGETL